MVPASDTGSKFATGVVTCPSYLIVIMKRVETCSALNLYAIAHRGDLDVA